MEKIAIQNLKCSGCGKTIKNGLEKIEGIKDIKVHVEENEISFSADSDESISQLKNKLKQMGYPPSGEVNSIGNIAKSYVSCAIGKMS